MVSICAVDIFCTVIAADVPCADNGGCSHMCAVIDGREECFCPPGFVLHIFNEQVCVGKPKADQRKVVTTGLT